MTYKLLQHDEIYKIYNTKFRIYKLYKKRKNEYINLLNYIKSNFNVIININKKYFSDAYFYTKLRQNLKLDNNQLIEKTKKLYRNKHIKNKVYDIIKYMTDIKNIHKILDIGTEDEYFLHTLEKLTGCDVCGINIKEGYEHYFNNVGQQNKIIYYDGINFPFKKDAFDLVTVIAVLHHVKNVYKFIKNLCKITKYVYIKDNDMVTHTCYDLIEIQHELYEGILYPNNRSPLFRLTKDYIIKKFKKYGFIVIRQTYKEIFTRPFSILLRKINS